MQNNKRKYPCPCYGFLTRSDSSYGTFEIRPICNWEDDFVQFNDPTYRGGANKENFEEARNNFNLYGAVAERFVLEVRDPKADEVPYEK
jgi:hypothetical protein